MVGKALDEIGYIEVGLQCLDLLYMGNWNLNNFVNSNHNVKEIGVCALCNIGRSLMSSVLWRWFCNFSTQVVGNLELRIYVKILFIFVENWISALHLKNEYIIPFQNSFSITICDNNTRHTGNILKMGKLTLCENLLKRITNSKSPCQATTMMQWYWYCHNYGWVLEGIHVQCWN